MCNFAFKVPIFDIRITGEFSPYIKHVAVEDHIKPKSGVFYPLAVGGGGGVEVSPRKFLKNGCNWCVLRPFSPIAC